MKQISDGILCRGEKQYFIAKCMELACPPFEAALRIRLFLVALAWCPVLVRAECAYDPELGEYRDSPALLMGVAMILMGVLLAYPLKDWAEEHPWLAAAAFFLVPVFLGVIGGGSCIQ